MIDSPTLMELLGRWWFSYDEGHFDVLATLLTQDARFTCRTDTGETEYEEFVRADHRGRDTVLAWQRQHRLDSPYPLRHMGQNLHATGRKGPETFFSSYIFVTQIVVGQVSNLSTGIVTGSARMEDGVAKVSTLNVILDTESSSIFKEKKTIR